MCSSDLGYEAAWDRMKQVALRAQKLKDELLQAVDLDTRAFNRVMEAFRLPRTTEEQVREREAAIEQANKEATLVPLSVLEKAVELAELAYDAASRGNQNSVSDAGVAAYVCEAALNAVLLSADINIPLIKDQEYVKAVLAEKERLVSEAKRLKDAAVAVVQERMK